MKKYLFLISILFSAAGVSLALYGIPVIPPVLVLIAFFISGNAIVSVSRTVDILSNSIAALSFSIALDPVSFGWPWFMLCFFFLACMPFLRLLFFKQIGFLKAVWYEPLVSMTALTFYIIANIKTSMGWEGWVFPVIPIAGALFRGLGTILDKKVILKSAKAKFNVDPGTPAPDFI